MNRRGGSIAIAGLFFAFSVSLAACPRLPVTPSDLPDGAADGGGVDAAADGGEDAAPIDFTLDTPCERACAVMLELSCPEAFTPDGGKSCREMCEAAEVSGKFDLRPECVGAAHTIEEVRACGTVRCMIPD